MKPRKVPGVRYPCSADPDVDSLVVYPAVSGERLMLSMNHMPEDSNDDLSIVVAPSADDAIRLVFHLAAAIDATNPLLAGTIAGVLIQQLALFHQPPTVEDTDSGS